MTPEFRPNVDGDVVLVEPAKVLAEGDSIRVPVMIGTVKDEFGTSAVSAIFISTYLVATFLMTHYHNFNFR